MLARLATLGPAVMGREVPVLLANDPDEPGALACTVGAIDLIYRDEQTGLPVIVDYKTDELPDAAAIDRRAQAYLPQIGVYQQAVQGALGLADPPAAELWFLQADRVWRTS